MLECEDIQWLIDALGTIQFMETVIDAEDAGPYVKDISERGSDPNLGKVKKGEAPDGLYFSGAHWYAVKGGASSNSYDKDYQISGTAHFCQTFAAMIFLGEDSRYDLRGGDYANNIGKAMAFWIDFFEEHEEIRIWFLKEVASIRKEEVSWQDLKKFLGAVQKSAANLTGCR